MELTSQYGYVFRVTCKEEKNIRNLKKFTTLDTNKAGVRYYQYFIKISVLKYIFNKSCFQIRKQSSAGVKQRLPGVEIRI